jgi:PhoH-like ATPase
MQNDGLKVEEKIDYLFGSGQIEVDSLTYIRGLSYIIIDYAQNLTLHEIKTITSRAGNSTKIVLSGDPYDNPYSNRLIYLVEDLKDRRYLVT